MMMSLKQSQLSAVLPVLYYKSSKTSNLPLLNQCTRTFATAQAAAAPNRQVSVSERLRLMVEKQEQMAAKVRVTKQTMGISLARAGGAAHPLDE